MSPVNDMDIQGPSPAIADDSHPFSVNQGSTPREDRFRPRRHFTKRQELPINGPGELFDYEGSEDEGGVEVVTHVDGWRRAAKKKKEIARGCPAEVPLDSKASGPLTLLQKPFPEPPINSMTQTTSCRLAEKRKPGRPKKTSKRRLPEASTEEGGHSKRRRTNERRERKKERGGVTFTDVWRELKQEGWCHKKGSGLISW